MWVESLQHRMLSALKAPQLQRRRCCGAHRCDTQHALSLNLDWLNTVDIRKVIYFLSKHLAKIVGLVTQTGWWWWWTSAPRLSRNGWNCWHTHPHQRVDKTGSMWQWCCFMVPIRCSLHPGQRSSMVVLGKTGDAVVSLGGIFVFLWFCIPHSDRKI